MECHSFPKEWRTPILWEHESQGCTRVDRLSEGSVVAHGVSSKQPYGSALAGVYSYCFSRGQGPKTDLMG